MAFQRAVAIESLRGNHRPKPWKTGPAKEEDKALTEAAMGGRDGLRPALDESCKPQTAVSFIFLNSAASDWPAPQALVIFPSAPELQTQ